MGEAKQKCFRSVLVYQPNPLRPDRVTVGFVLYEAAGSDRRVEVRFAPELPTLRCIAPELEVEMVEAMLLEAEPVLRSLVGNITDIARFPSLLPDSIPMELELLPSAPILTEDFDKELTAQSDQLFQSLDNEDLKEEQRKLRQYGRMYLHRQMRTAFDESGVRDHFDKRISVDKYMLKGDSYRIDYGFADLRTDTYQLFDAVSLVTSLDRARILALGWPKIRDGISHDKRMVKCEMHAIVEAGINRKAGKAKDAWEWMQDAGIRVDPVSALPVLAADARLALRL